MPDPQITPLSILFLLGAAQAAFFSFTLLTSHIRGKKTNRLANLYLAMFLAMFGLGLFNEFLDHSLYGLEYFQLMVLIFPTDFFLGPLIWLYTSNMTDRRSSWHWINSLHFLPALVQIAMIWPLAFQPSPIDANFLVAHSEFIQGNQIQSWILSEFVPLVPVLAVLQIGIYLALSLFLLKKHSQIIKNEFSYREGVSLTWLRSLLYSLALLYLLYVVQVLISDLLQMRVWVYADYALKLGMVFFVYSMAYFGARQPRIFYPIKNRSAAKSVESDNSSEPVIPEQIIERVKEDQPTSAKYVNSALSDEQSQRILARLNQAMMNDKPYLNSNLTLPELSKSISTSPNYLSQVINEKLEMNFFDYINSYRIEAAKNLLANPLPHTKTILDIAMESAFNSKSAFYSAFKKQTGITPNQYKKSLSL